MSIIHITALSLCCCLFKSLYLDRVFCCIDLSLLAPPFVSYWTTESRSLDLHTTSIFRLTWALPLPYPTARLIWSLFEWKLHGLAQLTEACILVWPYPDSTSYITLLNAISFQTVISSRKASSTMFIFVGDDVTGS